MLRERRRAANNKPNRRLDRKSSRGMIYENEELRLRTININAEVERGQSDIRKLRRENEHLRREIWALRDEYDRLDKLLRAHGRGSRSDVGHTSQEEASGSENNDSQSDDNVSCETCQGLTIESDSAMEQKNKEKDIAAAKKENLHVNFDHLSIVSEENLTIGNSPQNSPGGIGSTLTKELISSGMSPLQELQSVQPSLHHFENLSYETMGPSVDSNGRVIPMKPEIPIKPVIPLKLVLPPIKPKPHFFAPLRLGISPVRPKIEPIYATINKTRHPKLQLPTSSLSTFQNGGNLDDLLKDLSLSPSIESTNNFQPDVIMSESTTSPMDSSTTTASPTKKCRSEISLTLSNPTEFNKDEVDAPPPSQTKIGFESFTSHHPSIIEENIATERIYEKVDDGTNNMTDKLPPNGLPPSIPPSKRPSPVIDVRKKTRRISLSLAGNPLKKLDLKDRRASIDVITPTNSTLQQPLLRRHSTHQHHHRKASVSVDGLASSKGGGSSLKATNKEDGSTNENGRVKRSESRESTTSTNTQKSRNVSTSSHGGKIPWCGCWGNGCF